MSPVLLTLAAIVFIFTSIAIWAHRESNVLKGKHIVVVSTNRGNVIFDNYKIEDINDSTKFYWTLDHNHYNVEINHTLIYK